MNVLVAGSLNIDLFVKVNSFPKEGETLIGSSLTRMIGGKGVNQASAVIRQDIRTTMWGVVGNDDFGTHIMDECEKIGIHLAISKVDINTGTAIIETDIKGKNRIVVIPGANGEFTVYHAQNEIHLLDNCDILVLQFEIPLETVEFLAAEAKKRNKVVILNPAPAFTMSEDLLSAINYIIPNEHELGIITKMPTTNMNEIKLAAYSLKNKIPNVIVTLGEKGVYVMSDEFEGLISGNKVDVLDTTGAGDSFIGSLTGALAKGINLHDAIVYANKSAAISVTKQGAFNIAGTPSEVEKLGE